jgi:hypothetical protein
MSTPIGGVLVQFPTRLVLAGAVLAAFATGVGAALTLPGAAAPVPIAAPAPPVAAPAPPVIAPDGSRVAGVAVDPTPEPQAPATPTPDPTGPEPPAGREPGLSERDWRRLPTALRSEIRAACAGGALSDDAICAEA